MQGFELTMSDAKCPVLLVIRSSIRDEARLVRQGMEMTLEFAQRNALPHRHAVAHDVQIRLCKVDDFFAALVFYVRVANIPFARNDPVKNRGPGRNFMNPQGDVLVKLMQRMPYAIAGDAAANRVYFGSKSVDLFAGVRSDESLPTKSLVIHDVCLLRRSPNSVAN